MHPALSRPLLDFTDPPSANRFRIVDDTVMGGHSSSELRHAECSVMFKGVVAPENGRGFASFRGPLSLPHGMAAFYLNLRGDGRRYRVVLRTDDPEQGQTYHAPFATSGHWQLLRFTAGDFLPRTRGRAVSAPPFAFRRAVAFGILIADGQAGPFQIALRELRAA